MEQHFSARDSLALALFEGPHMLSHMLLESITLRDVRQMMSDEKIRSGSGVVTQVIKIDIKQVKMAIQEDAISKSILERIRKSTQFFSIMETLMSLSSTQNHRKILKLLMYVGENEYFHECISKKLDQINVSPDLLLCKENPSQTLVHLNYSGLSLNCSHLPSPKRTGE